MFTAFVVWIVIAASEVLGGATLDDPKDCITALKQTETCEGEDRSFQECLYRLRATGIPEAGVCNGFLTGAQAPPYVPPKPGAEPCPEREPTAWQEVSCESYRIGSDYRCFTCNDVRPPEHSRKLLQAFTQDCKHAIVLKACNEPLLAP